MLCDKCEQVAEEPGLPICRLLYRHVAHLAADALHSCPSPVPVPGLWDPSNAALRLILEVLHTLSRQAGGLQRWQHVTPWAH